MTNPLADPVPILPTSFLDLVNERQIGASAPLSEAYQIVATPPIYPSLTPTTTNGTIRLRECPQKLSTNPNVNVVIPGYTEIIPSTPFLSSNQFSVDYVNGNVSFAQGSIGNVVTVSYNGTGSIIQAADINNITAGLMQRITLVATSGQTIFTPGFPVSSTSTLVYSDGLLMTEGGSADYTTTGGGSSVTFNTGRSLGAIVNFVKIGA